MYAKRDKDETDWMAACVLWEQALEVMAEEDDRTMVCYVVLSLFFFLLCMHGCSVPIFCFKCWFSMFIPPLPCTIRWTDASMDKDSSFSSTDPPFSPPTKPHHQTPH
jgi:hypothetical protein